MYYSPVLRCFAGWVVLHSYVCNAMVIWDIDQDHSGLTLEGEEESLCGEGGGTHVMTMLTTSDPR